MDALVEPRPPAAPAPLAAPTHLAKPDGGRFGVAMLLALVLEVTAVLGLSVLRDTAPPAPPAAAQPLKIHAVAPPAPPPPSR
ncbi:MAG: hypothetical protein B7Z80_12265 [Rhodospirillales bacterium 20-64-7]|nr:MAG: hypothetical protein B7Z80_12265 [Rhodospirillales bacterium 20-64-7]